MMSHTRVKSRMAASALLTHTHTMSETATRAVVIELLRELECQARVHIDCAFADAPNSPTSNARMLARRSDWRFRFRLDNSD